MQSMFLKYYRDTFLYNLAFSFIDLNVQQTIYDLSFIARDDHHSLEETSSVYSESSVRI